MECQILFSGKYIVSLTSAEFAKRIVKVKALITTAADILIFVCVCVCVCVGGGGGDFFEKLTLFPVNRLPS